MYQTISLPTTPTIELRKNSASSLAFVNIVNGLSLASVTINTITAAVGDYNLVLESYDTQMPSTTLKTDFVTIKVYEYIRSSTITSPVLILKGNSAFFPV